MNELTAPTRIAADRTKRLTVVAALWLMASCSLFTNPVRDRYDMVRISEDPLPAVLDAITTVSGDSIEYVLVSGSLTLFGRGRFELESELHEVWDGVMRNATSRRDRGSYQRSETEIVIRFTDVEGIARVFTYSIIDEGRVLRGVQWGREAEYTK